MPPGVGVVGWTGNACWSLTPPQTAEPKMERTRRRERAKDAKRDRKKEHHEIQLLVSRKSPSIGRVSGHYPFCLAFPFALSLFRVFAFSHWATVQSKGSSHGNHRAEIRRLVRSGRRAHPGGGGEDRGAPGGGARTGGRGLRHG